MSRRAEGRMREGAGRLQGVHVALLWAAGAERFALDRLCLDGDPPLRCEVGRVREALERVMEALRADR